MSVVKKYGATSIVGRRMRIASILLVRSIIIII